MKTMRHSYFALGGLAILAMLSSCSGTPKTNDTAGNKNQNPRNLVKVLDGVRCHSTSNGCPQDDVNLIWGMCLRNGFQEEMPKQNIASARSIDELVSENITETKIRTETRTIDKTDANGIVTSEQVTTNTPYEDTRFLRGFCSGSEYILK